MSFVVFEVRYMVYRDRGNSAHEKKVIHIDEKIYAKNRYSDESMRKIFYPYIAIDHPKAYKIHVGNYRKLSEDRGTEDRENYTNIWNFFGGKKNEVKAQKVVKHRKSIWRSPTWMIPFRIIWYLIKKIFSIAGWLMEGKTN